MIALGALVALWGAVVLALARPMHERWKEMLGRMRRSGLEDSLALTRFFASREGLHGLQLAGGGAVLAGLALIVVGLLRGGGLWGGFR